MASYDKVTQKSFISQYPIFVNTTLSSKPDFKIYQDQVTTVYEGKNITSLAIDTGDKWVFAADRNDHKIIKFNYDPDTLEDLNITKPIVEPLYYNVKNLESVALFNSSLYYTSAESDKTLVKVNREGWENSTHVIVQNGLARSLTIDQDEAWYLDSKGNLIMVDLDPLDTLLE